MGQMDRWKILEDATVQLRKKGVEISPGAIDDLRSAKSMIKISETEQANGELLQKIDQCMQNVEAYLSVEVQNALGEKFLDEMLKRLEKAHCETCQTQTVESKFISGVPRDQKWIRVEPIQSLSNEKISLLAKEQNLSVISQENGKLVVYGKPENISGFVKKLTSQSSQGKKEN